MPRLSSLFDDKKYIDQSSSNQTSGAKNESGIKWQSFVVSDFGQ